MDREFMKNHKRIITIFLIITMIFVPLLANRGFAATTKGTLKVQLKTTTTNAYSINGTKYGVYSNSACTKSVKSLTLNSSGTATASLTAGVYYVKETSATTGWVKDTYVYKAVVAKGCTTTIKPIVTPSVGTLKIKMKSTGSSAYEFTGAVFTIYSDSACSKSVAKVTADESGIASMDIASGVYYVKETTMPVGWKKGTTAYKATIKNGLTTTITSTVEPSNGTLKLQMSKTATNGYSIKGSVYTVYTDSYCANPVTKLTVNASGTASVSLTPGTYYVKETTAMTGWQKDTILHKVEVKALSTVTAVSRVEPSKGTLKVQMEKTASGRYSLKGAVYTVYSNPACTTKVTKMTANASGVASTSLATGTYYVKETATVTGWQKDTNAHKITVKSLATALVTSTVAPK